MVVHVMDKHSVSAVIRYVYINILIVTKLNKKLKYKVCEPNVTFLRAWRQATASKIFWEDLRKYQKKNEAVKEEGKI